MKLFCWCFLMMAAVGSYGYGAAEKAFSVASVPASSPLVYFTAVCFNHKVRVSWNTEHEAGIKNFEVERSSDGAFFSPVATIAAKNVEGINNYTFTDSRAMPGTVYYRLKIKNSNGSFHCSNITVVNITKEDDLKIIPNLVSTDINIFHSRAKAGAKVEIYAADGRKLMQLPVAKRARQTHINPGAVPSGTYNLVFVNEGEVEVVRFVKL